MTILQCRPDPNRPAAPYSVWPPSGAGWAERIPYRAIVGVAGRLISGRYAIEITIPQGGAFTTAAGSKMEPFRRAARSAREDGRVGDGQHQDVGRPPVCSASCCAEERGCPAGIAPGEQDRDPHDHHGEGPADVKRIAITIRVVAGRRGNGSASRRRNAPQPADLEAVERDLDVDRLGGSGLERRIARRASDST